MHSIEGNLTKGRIVYPVLYIVLFVRFIQSEYVDKAAQFHDALKTLKLKTLASDCVITKDVATIPLLIYYVKLYMLHPLSALILET